MGRPTVDLEPHKETILGLYSGGASVVLIAEYLAQENPTENPIKISSRTIKRRLSAWASEDASDPDIQPKRKRTEDSPQLRERIKELFEMGKGDDEICDSLESEGFKVGKTAVVRLRKKMGLLRRGGGDAMLWEKMKREGKVKEGNIQGEETRAQVSSSIGENEGEPQQERVVGEEGQPGE